MLCSGLRGHAFVRSGNAASRYALGGICLYAVAQTGKNIETPAENGYLGAERPAFTGFKLSWTNYEAAPAFSVAGRAGPACPGRPEIILKKDH